MSIRKETNNEAKGVKRGNRDKWPNSVGECSLESCALLAKRKEGFYMQAVCLLSDQRILFGRLNKNSILLPKRETSERSDNADWKILSDSTPAISPLETEQPESKEPREFAHFSFKVGGDIQIFTKQ
jgi:hypothetical protein